MKPKELQEFLRRQVLWTPTRDPDSPWSAVLDEGHCRLQVNDFPDEPMYSLLVDGKPVGDFDDWPVNWKRDDNADGLAKGGKARLAAVK